MRVYLNVPYAEKDAAKARGARWDMQSRRWYVEATRPLGALSKWLPDWHSLAGKPDLPPETMADQGHPVTYRRFTNAVQRDNHYRLKHKPL